MNYLVYTRNAEHSLKLLFPYYKFLLSQWPVVMYRVPIYVPLAPSLIRTDIERPHITLFDSEACVHQPDTIFL
jgi:hypothetical protein